MKGTLYELRAEARVVHPGKTLAVVEAAFYNHEGRIAAKSLGTFFRDTKTRGVEVDRQDRAGFNE